jgi:hypothetical protein
VFPKAKRKTHEDPLDVPGPGYYSTQDQYEKVRHKSPRSITFGKSPKVSIFDTVHTEAPGHIYYPSVHFVSK